MPMRHGREDFGGELFGEEHGALGLAAGAEVPCAAGECEQMFRTALWTANPGKPPFQAAAGEEVLHRAHDHGPQRPGAGLEAIFIRPDIAVEVSLEQLVEAGALGMPGPVSSGGFRDGAS